MNFRSKALLFVVTLALALLAAALLMYLPALLKLGLGTLAVIPILITGFGIISCIDSGKPTNILLLWIIIMILAPLLGPLLWFAWGKHNT